MWFVDNERDLFTVRREINVIQFSDSENVLRINDMLIQILRG